MKKGDPKELSIDELLDMHDAEDQSVKALRKMAKAAESDELRSDFEEHLEQTKVHVQRHDQIFQALNRARKARTAERCRALSKRGRK